ncbi:MAG: hypothetical protein K2Q22_08125 [Cytophagales bacterium]|nr:hypothetical protein [Cytophagales bacterium]
MNKFIAIIAIAVLSTACVKDQQVSEDLKQVKADLKALREDLDKLKTDGVKADSAALSEANKKFNEVGNSLEGENDPANQGDFKELEKKH